MTNNFEFLSDFLRSCYFWRIHVFFGDNFGNLTTKLKKYKRFFLTTKLNDKMTIFLPYIQQRECPRWFRSWHPTVGKHILNNIGTLSSRVGLATQKISRKTSPAGKRGSDSGLWSRRPGAVGGYCVGILGGFVRCPLCERVRVKQDLSTIL